MSSFCQRNDLVPQKTLIKKVQVKFCRTEILDLEENHGPQADTASYKSVLKGETNIIKKRKLNLI